MALALKLQADTKVPGRTLLSTTAGVAHAGVYMPPAHADKALNLNVVLWLHGHFVKDPAALMLTDPALIRDSVHASGRDVVLVAPFLGYRPAGDDGAKRSTYDVTPLGGANWGQTFLDEVLAALPAPDGSAQTPAWRINNLALACHSGGGAAMRLLQGTLGRHRAVLRACWGFDCLYGVKAQPDDANFWHDLVQGKDGMPLYVMYGPSTLPQSVKLDLMGQGLADGNGDRALPNKHPPLPGLQVEPGLTLSVRPDRLMFPEAGKAAAHARAVARSAVGKGVFVSQAVTSLQAALRWDKGAHYRIAREGLLARLKAWAL